MIRVNPYQVDLDKNAAKITRRCPRCRCWRLASALKQSGIAAGDTVAAMLPNVPAMYEAHFGVPMTGAAARVRRAEGRGAGRRA